LSSRQAAFGPAGVVAPAQHQHTNRHHHQREEEQELLSVDRLAERGPDQRAEDARGRVHSAALPLDRMRAGMAGEAGARIGGHRQCARSDRDVRAGHPDEVDHQRHREDRAAAAHQPE